MKVFWIDGIGPVRPAPEGHAAKRMPEIRGQFGNHRRGIRPHDERRHQDRVLAFAFGGTDDKIGKAGLVGAKAAAGDVVIHERAPAIAAAQVEKCIQGQNGGRAVRVAKTPHQRARHLVPATLTIGPEAEMENCKDLGRAKVADQPDRRSSPRGATGTHDVMSVRPTRPPGDDVWNGLGRLNRMRNN